MLFPPCTLHGLLPGGRALWPHEFTGWDSQEVVWFRYFWSADTRQEPFDDGRTSRSNGRWMAYFFFARQGKQAVTENVAIRLLFWTRWKNTKNGIIAERLCRKQQADIQLPRHALYPLNGSQLFNSRDELCTTRRHWSIRKLWECSAVTFHPF